MDETILLDLFENLLRQIAGSAVGDEEHIALWMNIGKKLGVHLYLPEMKAVAITDEDTGERHVVAFIATINEEITEYVTSENVFDSEIVSRCLELKKQEQSH